MYGDKHTSSRGSPYQPFRYCETEFFDKNCDICCMPLRAKSMQNKRLLSKNLFGTSRRNLLKQKKHDTSPLWYIYVKARFFNILKGPPTNFFVISVGEKLWYSCNVILRKAYKFQKFLFDFFLVLWEKNLLTKIVISLVWDWYYSRSSNIKFSTCRRLYNRRYYTIIKHFNQIFQNF